MPESVRKLGIVGASVRAAAFSALRAGYEVVAADLFADADLQRHCAATQVLNYPTSLAEWLASAECDAWFYTGALENHPNLVEHMATIRPLLGNSGNAIRNVRDPLVLQGELGAAGLNFPETVCDPNGLPLNGSWLCKTYRGASGSGVWRLDGAESLARARTEQAVFQRVVSGTNVAATYVVGQHFAWLAGVTLQLVGDQMSGAKEWQYSGSVGPISPRDNRADQLQLQFDRLGEILSRRFELRGVVGVDLVVDEENRPWVIEVNPRYSASVEVVEAFTGVPIVPLHVAACHMLELPSTPAQRVFESQATAVDRRCGKAVVFAKEAVTISREFHRWAMEHATLSIADQRLADIPHAGERIAAGMPVLTVLVTAVGFEPCVPLIKERIAEVERRLYAYQ